MPNMPTPVQNIEPDQPTRQGTRLLRWLPLWAGLALAACASLDSAPPEDQVRQRATERWQAMVAGDFSSAYNYYLPGFRAVITPDGFRVRYGGTSNVKATEVVSVNCPEATKCMATVRLDFKPLLGRKFGDKISTHIDETWLLEDGKWWLFQRL